MNHPMLSERTPIMKQKRRIIILAILGVLLVIYAGLFAAARYRRNAAFARLEARVERIHSARPGGKPPKHDPEVTARWKALKESMDSRRWDSHMSNRPDDIAAKVNANQDIFEEMCALAYEDALLSEDALFSDSPDEVVDWSFGTHATVSHCVRYLYDAANVHTEQGRVDDAIEYMAAALDLADRADVAPSTIGHLRRLADLRCVLLWQSSWTLADPLSREQTMKLVEAASAARKRHALAEAWAVETKFSLKMMSDLRKTPPECPFWDNELEWLKEWTLWLAYANPFSTPWQDYDEGTYLIFMERLIALGEQPYYKAVPGLGTWYNDWRALGPLNFLSQSVFSAYVAVQEPFDRSASVNIDLDLFRLRLLLDLYRQENGAYPKTLDPLAGDLGGTVPVDPSTGKPYVYTPREDYYLLSRP